jgi:hypothetical protein
MQTEPSQSGVPYAPSLFGLARATAGPELPRQDLIVVRAPDGSRWTIQAIPEVDEYLVEPLSAGVSQRHTPAQAGLLLAIAAGAMLVECLTEDLEPGMGVREVLTDAWGEVIASPPDGFTPFERFDLHAQQLGADVVQQLLRVGLGERRCPGAPPSAADPYIRSEVDRAWKALWSAAAAPGAWARFRRGVLGATYFGVVARAPVPDEWITPRFKGLVVERLDAVDRGMPRRVTVQRVDVKRVMGAWSSHGVPRRLKGQVRAARAQHPCPPLVVAAVSDGKRGTGGRDRVLAADDLALDLPTLDRTLLDRLELAVTRVPRELPRVPAVGPGEDEAGEGEGPPPPDPVDQEQVGEFLLLAFADAVSVVHRPTGNRVAGLLLTEEEWGWIRTALGKASERGLDWVRIAPHLHLIAGGGADPGRRRAGISFLYRAVGLPEPWEQAEPR